jgi:hypothetical protein
LFSDSYWNFIPFNPYKAPRPSREMALMGCS